MMKLFPTLLAALISGATLTAAPADFTSGASFDTVADGGAVHLLFGQNDENDQLAFFHTRSDNAGKGWSKPVAVPTDHAPPGRHQRGHDPKLAVSGDNLMALWTGQGGGPFGSGRLAVARSSDGGKTWKAGSAPAAAEPETENAGFRFPAVAADSEAFHTIWIHAQDAERSLRHAKLPFGAEEWSQTTTIDGHICACCWNQLRVTDDGTLVALYRDQEPSDMALAVSEDGGSSWERIGPVGAFDWHFLGCPHVGGGLAPGSGGFGETRLLATAWTGDEDSRGSYLLTSDDGGRSWNPQLLPETDLPGNVHTDLARISDQQAAVVWDRSLAPGSRAIFAALTSDAGNSWGDPQQLSEIGANATHPRIVATGESYLVFWTETADDGSVELRFTALPGK